MRIKSLLLPVVTAAVVLVVALALAGGNGSSSGSTPTTTASTKVLGGHTSVTIKNYMYAPDTITVKVGTRVKWTNKDQTAHTATANAGGFDTGTINPGQSKTVKFKHPGTYPYHCSFHAFMTGTVKVVG